MAADVKEMMAQLKDLRAKSNDEKYPADVREKFDQQANTLELKILKANKVPGFSYGGAAKKKKAMHRMPDGSMMKGATHKMMGGGYAKKTMAMNKGGYANCGASVKPNGPRKA